MTLARASLRYLLEAAGIAAACALLGFAGLAMALPPHAGAPLAPAAGVALAALFSLGPRHWPAVLIGSLVVHASSAAGHADGAPWLPVVLAAGAAGQAALGSVLLRRWCETPLLLDSLAGIGRFLLLGIGVAGLVSPSISTLAQLGAGQLTGAQWPPAWGMAWLSDALGVLIAAPLTLCLVGQPRAAWAPRRVSVGLPMLATLGLVAWGTTQVLSWEQQQNAREYSQLSADSARALSQLMREAVTALEGLGSVLHADPDIDRAEFARATAALLDEDSPLLALGHAQRVRRAELAGFNQRAVADGLPGFVARDRGRAGDLTSPVGEDMLVIRLIEPIARNAGALGVNLRSIPSTRTATADAAATGLVRATAGFQLSQDRDTSIGIVIYRPIYSRELESPTSAAANSQAREHAFRGVALAAARPDLLLRRVTSRWPADLSPCLVDLTVGAPVLRLAGHNGCEGLGDVAERRVFAQRLEVAGRQWEFRLLSPDRATVASNRSGPFAIIGLASAGLVGVLLLLLSGRNLRVEQLVKLRTSALHREMAEREAGDRALRASEQRFRNIFEHAPIGIAFTDMRGAFQEVNPHFARMVGYPVEALLTKRSVDITHPDDVKGDLKLATQLQRGTLPYYRRVKRHLAADGRVLHTRALVSLLHGPDGRPHRFVGVVEDITEQLRAQELETAREAAEAANRAKTEFLSRMSHELRTPMNAILGFTQLMELDVAEPLQPGQRARVQQIAQAGWHLLVMINDTLDLSRIESGALHLQGAVLNLPQLIGQTLSLLQQQATEKHLRITQSIAPAAQQVFGDPTRVVQILTNLISNAIKYNHDAGFVSIEVSTEEPGWVLTRVRDNGLGLTAEQRAGLFQPFNRLGREAGSAAGTGIGLVISRQLAELMSGSLDWEDPGSTGSCFVLRLPTTEPNRVAPDAAMTEDPTPVTRQEDAAE